MQSYCRHGRVLRPSVLTAAQSSAFSTSSTSSCLRRPPPSVPPHNSRPLIKNQCEAGCGCVTIPPIAPAERGTGIFAINYAPAKITWNNFFEESRTTLISFRKEMSYRLTKSGKKYCRMAVQKGKNNALQNRWQYYGNAGGADAAVRNTCLPVRGQYGTAKAAGGDGCGHSGINGLERFADDPQLPGQKQAFNGCRHVQAPVRAGASPTNTLTRKRLFTSPSVTERRNAGGGFKSTTYCG